MLCVSQIHRFGWQLTTTHNGKLLKKQKMGIKKIDGFTKAVVEKISDANGQKYTNHSNRKTLITTLLGNILERSDIGQLSGHGNVQNLDSYASTPHKTQRRMPSTISKWMCSEIVQSETPHSFQEPASTLNSSDATRVNPTVVFNATGLQNSFNAHISLPRLALCLLYKTQK